MKKGFFNHLSASIFVLFLLITLKLSVYAKVSNISPSLFNITFSASELKCDDLDGVIVQ